MIIEDQNRGLQENQAFIHAVNTKGTDKTANMLTDFVRLKIRETGFTRKILPPKQITSTDLDRSVDTDTPMRIIEVDRLSEAYTVTFQEQAQERYYTGNKFQVFYKQIMSEKFFKPTQEIMTYRTPIKTIVQENYLKDIQIEEDGTFIAAIEKIIAKRKAQTGTTSAETAELSLPGIFTPDVLASGLQNLSMAQVPVGTILINEVDFLDLLKSKQTAVGSPIMENIIKDGYSYTTLLGHNFVRTIKHDIVKPGNIYIFSTPEYFGVFDILEDVKAFVKQEGSSLEFYLWETIGMAIGNIMGVTKIKLGRNPGA
jgi:hypothetical protein